MFCSKNVIMKAKKKKGNGLMHKNHGIKYMENFKRKQGERDGDAKEFSLWVRTL